MTSEKTMINLNNEINPNDERTFSQRIDFYWQYFTAYFVVLLMYGILRGSVEQGYFTMKWQDPVVLLLFAFMLLSATFLLGNFLKKKSITVGKDFITFKTRMKTRHYKAEDIIAISVGKYSKRNPSTIYRIVKIKVKNRKYAIRFRPNGYENDEILIKYIHRLKHEVDKNRNNTNVKQSRFRKILKQGR